MEDEPIEWVFVEDGHERNERQVQNAWTKCAQWGCQPKG